MKRFKCFFLISLLSISFSFANTEDPQLKNRKYISTESLVFIDGQLLVIENDCFFKPGVLYQDDLGIFIIAGFYGDCPNGHPYSGPDGGCTGIDCPYN